MGATVLERGWLSANNILFADGPAGAAVVDTGYCSQADQTIKLIAAALKGQMLRRILNTHLHSDHCGGNAALQSRWSCKVLVPAASLDAVAKWDANRLSFEYTGQSCPRFSVHGALESGGVVELGCNLWDVIPAKGHDPDAVLLFEPKSRILIAGDALWESRLAIVFPELAGESGFSEARETLGLIEALDPYLVIPGHGPPFTDVRKALTAAHTLLDRCQAEPTSHHEHAARSLLMFRMLELRACTADSSTEWLCQTAVFTDILARCGGSLARCGGSYRDQRAFASQITAKLLSSGVLRQDPNGLLRVMT